MLAVAYRRSLTSQDALESYYCCNALHRQQTSEHARKQLSKLNVHVVNVVRYGVKRFRLIFEKFLVLACVHVRYQWRVLTKFEPLCELI